MKIKVKDELNNKTEVNFSQSITISKDKYDELMRYKENYLELMDVISRQRWG